MTDLRYHIFEVVGNSLQDVRGKGRGSEGEFTIGQMYASCDDFDLAFKIHAWLSADSGAEPLQLMIYDSLEETGMTPA